MIPTTTYDQIRLEQHNQLARLELRRHEKAAARRQHAEQAPTQAVHSSQRRTRWATAVVTAGLTVATLLLIL
ncbi:MAG TPA: hypothetical protein VMP67_08385 [Candidatus Limnocylindria bacterium]|nr:hypothetical protein [Candidatus Limnocylindria bacterium]